MTKVIPVLLIALFLVSCGYRPASYYTANALDGNVFVDIKIDRNDPQSGPVLIDALNTAVVSRFGKRLAPREAAATKILVESGTYGVRSLQRDENGFTILYRSSVLMNVVVNSSRLTDAKFSVSGQHDFATESSSVLSDTMRNTAAREAALKALDMLLARLVLLGEDLSSGAIDAADQNASE
ncbi:MAG: hypothetical protein LBU73_08830 [Helicobacteraceae bacterium]|jgi:hypothetical protein|nr:hypothetical protein [Helicobacteraceae bacterium]